MRMFSAVLTGLRPIAALIVMALPLASYGAENLEWRQTKLGITFEDVPGSEHYWSAKLSTTKRGIVGLNDVLIVEMFKFPKPMAMRQPNQAPYNAYAFIFSRIYTCAIGSYKSVRIYIVKNPDVFSPDAEVSRTELPDDDPVVTGTLKRDTPHWKFLNEICERA